MASIEKSLIINSSPDRIWDAVRDVGAIHRRLAPGVVANTEMLEDTQFPTRRVTFAQGPVVDEIIVDVDEARRRLVWSVRADQFAHHNGAMQVHDADGGARVTWIADVLPDALAAVIEPMMEAGMQAMKRHLEAEAVAA
jgi:hypothetical protein